MRRFIVVGVFLLLAAPLLQAVRSEVEEVRAAARGALIERLGQLAGWCHDQNLFLERDDTWRRILEIDPENAAARKGLRYTKGLDGAWREPAPRTVKNLNKAALEELPERRAAAIAPYSAALLEVVQRDGADREARQAVLEEILTLDPDDTAVHGLLGEVKDGEVWKLADTLRAKSGRARIRAAVQAAIARPIDSETAQPTPEEAALSTGWSCGTRSGAVRVLAVGEADCARTQQAVVVTDEVLRRVLDTQTRVPATSTFYVVPGNERAVAFLEHWPSATSRDVEFLTKMAGGGLPASRDVGLFPADPRWRLDCTVRNRIGHVFQETFHVGLEHGWAWEGLGIYLTRELTGTRLTWYLLATKANAGDVVAALNPESNWMAEGHRVLSAAAPPDMATVLDMHVSRMGVSELLASYVLSAWMLEAHHDVLPEVLQKIGGGAPSSKVVPDAVELPLSEIRPRLVRWLEERR